jgi:hypothetical protein
LDLFPCGFIQIIMNKIRVSDDGTSWDHELFSKLNFNELERNFFELRTRLSRWIHSDNRTILELSMTKLFRSVDISWLNISNN